MGVLYLQRLTSFVYRTPSTYKLPKLKISVNQIFIENLDNSLQLIRNKTVRSFSIIQRYLR